MENIWNVHRESKDSFLKKFSAELKDKASVIPKNWVYLIKSGSNKLCLGLFDKKEKVWNLRFVPGDSPALNKTVYFVTDAPTPEALQLELMIDLPKIGLNYKEIKVQHGRFAEDVDKFCVFPARLNGHDFQAICKIDRYCYALDGAPDRLNAIVEITEPFVFVSKHNQQGG